MGSDLEEADLRGTIFTSANLEGANLARTSLGRAILTDSSITGANLSDTTGDGFSFAQLSSTRSFQRREMTGTILRFNNLSGWDFSHQNLAHADFTGSQLLEANFTGADLRGAVYWNPDPTTIVRNTLRPDGMLIRLDLTGASTSQLVIRNHPLPIQVVDALELSAESVLAFQLDEQAWTATLHIGDGVTPELGGTLRLSVAEGTLLGTLLDQPLPLFDWNDRLPAEQRFEQIASLPGLVWDTSRLYTTGEVVLAAIQPTVLGDVDLDGKLSSVDIDQLSRALALSLGTSLYDMDRDGKVSITDRRFWVHEIARTQFGDSNLDGRFDSRDLVDVFVAGEYEDAFEHNSGWATGDWNGDFEFSSSDVVLVFQEGGFQANSTSWASPVPEPPHGIAHLLVCMALVIGRARARSGMHADRQHGRASLMLH
jgi:hypothetical protein